MKREAAFERIKKQSPNIIFLNGKTSTGKSTFANRLHSQLGYEIVDLDALITTAVMIPLGISDRHLVVPEIYKFRTKMDWLRPFLAATRKLIRDSLMNGQPAVVDGALSNPTTIKELFDGFTKVEIVYFHPKDLAAYNSYLVKRFRQADENNGANLPNNFWDLIDKDEFRKYLKTKVLSQKLKQSINNYAVRSQRNSDKRLAELKKNFDTVLVVEI